MEDSMEIPLKTSNKTTMFCAVLSHVQLFATPWTIACQGPLSMEFSRQKYWSELLFPSPGIFPTQELNPRLLSLLHWQVDSLPLHQLGSPKSVLIDFHSNLVTYL